MYIFVLFKFTPLTTRQCFLVWDNWELFLKEVKVNQFEVLLICERGMQFLTVPQFVYAKLFCVGISWNSLVYFM